MFGLGGAIAARMRGAAPTRGGGMLGRVFSQMRAKKAATAPKGGLGTPGQGHQYARRPVGPSLVARRRGGSAGGY